MSENEEPAACRHSGTKVTIGSEELYVGGTVVERAFVTRADLLVISGWLPLEEGMLIYKPLIAMNVAAYELPQKMPWWQMMTEGLLPEFKKGRRILCTSSYGHGFTGLVIGSLLAHLEPEEGAVAATKERYCRFAFETRAQERFVCDYAADL